MLKRLFALPGTPELNVALLAFLLNLPRTRWQVLLFERMDVAPKWETVKTCRRAAVGDAAIALVSYWLAE